MVDLILINTVIIQGLNKQKKITQSLLAKAKDN